MAKLKIEIQKNNYIAPKSEPTNVHFVVVVRNHDLVVRREKDDELLEVKKRLINQGIWAKVSPEVAKVLYEEIANTNSNDSDDKSSK